MDPFQQTTYQLALFTTGQLTADELNTSLKATVPEMKAALDAEKEPKEPPQQQPQY